MKKGCLVAFVLLVALFLGLCGWWMFNGGAPSPRTYGYRLTLYVETPEGERIGSNVVQVKTRFYVGLQRALNSYSSVAVRGEATVVDLGSRGLLFIAFRGDTTRGGTTGFRICKWSSSFSRARNFEELVERRLSAYLDELMRRKPKADLPLKELPMLVRFRDTNDPATVERVDPDNLDASFGRGDAQTDDAGDHGRPVSNGIVKQLPWLEKGYPETRLVSATGRPVSEVPPEQLLTHMDFRQVQQ